jgi:acyl carrier protein
VVSRSEFDAELAAFVDGLGDGRSMSDVAGDENLFDAGVLDSFSVIKLIAFVEGVVGRPIDLERATIDTFATADLIFRSFVDPGPATSAGPRG